MAKFLSFILSFFAKILVRLQQEYIIRRLTCRDVVVQGNPRVYKALKNQMAAIHEELKRLETVSPDNDELLYTLQVIAITLEGLKGEDE